LSDSPKKTDKRTPEDLLEDEMLVERAQNGEIEAYDQLVLKHNKKIYSMVYHMTKDSDESYDLLQDIFTKGYRSIKKFQRKSTFYTWIYSIGVNMTINYLKKRKRRQTYSLDDEDNGIMYNTSSPATGFRADPRREADLQVLQKKMNEAIGKLSDHHRVVVILYDIQGLPQAEISQILGVSEGTVRSRLFYAHKQLQNYLQSIKDQLS